MGEDPKPVRVSSDRGGYLKQQIDRGVQAVDCVRPRLELSALWGVSCLLSGVLSVFAGLEWICVPEEEFGRQPCRFI